MTVAAGSSIMHARYRDRLDKLRRVLDKLGTDALLVSSFANVTYLTGFTGDDSYLLVSPQDPIILSDLRYTTQLQEECPGFELELRAPGTTMLQLVSRVVTRAGRFRLAIEADAMTVSFHEQLQAAIAADADRDQLRPGGGSAADQGARGGRRDPPVDRSGAAGVCRRSRFPATRTDGETARQRAGISDPQVRRARLQLSAPIVAVGPRAALPHAVPTDRRIADSDFVLIDWGAFAGLYASDLTRILVTGRISPKLERIYGVVLTAQLRAIDAIRPGVKLSEVDAAARSVIAQAGFGEAIWARPGTWDWPADPRSAASGGQPRPAAQSRYGDHDRAGDLPTRVGRSSH